MTWGEHVMGHEGAGVVEDVGGDCGFQLGDHVVLNWAIPCGRCFQCVCGAEHLCEDKPAVQADRTTLDGIPLKRDFGLGTMSALTVVRQEALTRIPPDVPFSSACILGCGVMTGFGSAVNAARVTEGSSVAVIGVGGVGLNVIQGCRYAGAADIIAIDRHRRRLDAALSYGATRTIVAPDAAAGFGFVVDELHEMTSGRGVDYAFECTAVPELGSAPLSLTRNGGTAVAVSGIEQRISFDMELFEWDKNYINPLYGQCRPSRDFPLLLKLYEAGELDLDGLISRTYGLAELEAAFEDMHRGEISKGVILFG
jgi:S-(hydroxymethyl)glutathione dehydrogenase/alcohol dehydrogenase